MSSPLHIPEKYFLFIYLFIHYLVLVYCLVYYLVLVDLLFSTLLSKRVPQMSKHSHTAVPLPKRGRFIP